jgi:hypothetical protein
MKRSTFLARSTQHLLQPGNLEQEIRILKARLFQLQRALDEAQRNKAHKDKQRNLPAHLGRRGDSNPFDRVLL